MLSVNGEVHVWWATRLAQRLVSSVALSKVQMAGGWTGLGWLT